MSLKNLQNVSLLNTPVVRLSVWLYRIATTIWMMFEERKMKPKVNPLTRQESAAIRSYWKRFKIRISTSGFQFYKDKTGRFDVRFIPKRLYHARIDPYFNHPIIVFGTDNKNYYDLLFPEIKQPGTIVRRINGAWCDAAYNLIDRHTAQSLCREAGDLVGKEAVVSYDGFGITFWRTADGEDALTRFVDRLSRDAIVQARIRQHPALAAIHPSSVNPIRVVTLLLDGAIHVLPTVLKIGVNHNQTDRFADGALVCGIQPDGRLMSSAFTEYGEKFDQHPQGFVFSDAVVPSLDRVIAVAKQLHARLGNYRMLAWDISVDETGDPILVEVNMSGGGSVIIQLPHGPLFGDLTERVLKEVFART